jgi:hypothetical protein
VGMGKRIVMIPLFFLSIYLGVYKHEVLVLTEYPCWYEHGNHSVSIVALKECSGLTIRLYPSLVASPYRNVDTFRSAPRVVARLAL